MDREMDTKQEGLKLSKREREVMQLLAGGRTVKCVAFPQWNRGGHG